MGAGIWFVAGVTLVSVACFQQRPGDSAKWGCTRSSTSVGCEERVNSPIDLFEVVADDLLILNKNLQSIVGAENPVLMSAAEQIFGAGGKRMRPALVFLASRATAEIVGFKELTTEHRRLAEIIEMIHTASLIHDDVLDESDMRRGRIAQRLPPVTTIMEFLAAEIDISDSLVTDITSLLPPFKRKETVHQLYVIKLISQVIKDFASASLIAASTKAAAIFSGVEGSVSERMYQYGKNLGLSFQVVDDILDFTQSAEQLGKPAGSDLAKGNLTAPIELLGATSSNQTEKFMIYLHLLATEKT
ncbi:hypothetical protein F0562_009052 [Nyssa sinensis]|uniref:Uncharacterized protein n=1 Tax=Nyssa sinensis TaxID=561372 RepID=A0A5J5A8S7_9ASTE|nr:hypothetical protein F0562_009052 [Nyssa sinensis]